MTKPEEVKEKIIKTFIEDLNNHLFSEKSYPIEVTIRTVYPKGTQTLTINFDKPTDNDIR